MYTLRRISSTGVQMNFALGQSYTVVHRFNAYEEFQRDFQKLFDKPHVADLDPTADEDTKEIYALVGNHEGTHIYPLYSNQMAYIMTESGVTFSNLTLREQQRNK